MKGKWYTGIVVKYERWGITRKYSVKAISVVFDKDIPCPNKTYEVGSPDVRDTGEKRVVRYWSSGTPCMRSTGVDTFAVPTPEEAAAAAAAKANLAPKGPVK